MTFLWPFLLVLLLLVPALAALYVWQQRRRRPVGGRFSSLSLIRAAAPARRDPAPPAVRAVPGRRSGRSRSRVARPVAIVDVPDRSAHGDPRDRRVAAACAPRTSRPAACSRPRQAASEFIQREAATARSASSPSAASARWSSRRRRTRKSLLDAVNSLTTGQRTAIGSGILDLDRRHRGGGSQRCRAA